ncbi:uncharacterized protein SCHCODRAFT_02569047 [Schizophyllum commune H4-8]|uniref:uncharacterized protein n=1 Tax=Schizophyllum commune (strain H4-8 / FGSC 9210) TaxID=578458 RepID=UPI0021605551|nr:uncharacterized protein SCHCODRAFT_02569047 [Schizophyllum commune H4-8]KAI5896475.1 hypothetical protein SCHCODRAFT_02569047 [Schizophyllum commune H4-8]
MDALRDELKEKFGDDLANNDALLEESVQLCTHHGLDADSFLWKWEAMKWEMGKDIRGKPPAFDADKLNAIRAGLHRKLADEERQRAKTRAPAVATRGAARALPGMRAMGMGSSGSRPLPPFAQRGRAAPVKAEPMDVDVPVAGPSTGGSTIVGTSSSARAAHLHFVGPDMSEEAKKARAYRYMYSTIHDRSIALDDRIEDFVNLVQTHYGTEPPEDPASKSSDLTLVVGRVTSDTDGAKLADSTLRIETARYLGAVGGAPLRLAEGFRVVGRACGVAQSAVDSTSALSPSAQAGDGNAETNGASQELESSTPSQKKSKRTPAPIVTIPGAPLALFPGAIVALRGRNGAGTFVAEEALVLPPLPPPPGYFPSIPSGLSSSTPSMTPSSSTPYPAPSTSSAPFTMAVFAGPYTSDSDLNFAPWQSALAALREEAVDVVVLLGPFLDSAHPLIKTGDADEPLHRMFLRRFLMPLRRWLNGVGPVGGATGGGGGGGASESAGGEDAGEGESKPLGSKGGRLALLIPSVRDALSNHLTFPQAELAGFEAFDERIRFLPNPARFAINGVSFAATSAETVFHLQAERLLKRGAGPPESGDPVANLYRVMLEQRSFYPLFPGLHPGDVHLDVAHLSGLTIGTTDSPEKTKPNGAGKSESESVKVQSGDGEPRPWEQTAPDVLIVPTRLKEMAKRVSTMYPELSAAAPTSSYTTLAVNPSYVAKGRHAVLQVNPGATGEGRVQGEVKTH